MLDVQSIQLVESMQQLLFRVETIIPMHQFLLFLIRLTVKQLSIQVLLQYLTPIIGPKGGHGADAIQELGGFFILINSRLEYSESNNFHY